MKRIYINAVCYFIALILGGNLLYLFAGAGHEKFSIAGISSARTNDYLAEFGENGPRAVRINHLGKSYIVFRYTPSDDSIKLSISGNKKGRKRTLSDMWNACQGSSVNPVMIMNAGMYQKDYTAQGLLIEKGRISKSLDRDTTPGRFGNFYLYPNGVFAVKRDGQAEIITTSDYSKKYGGKGRWISKPYYATQSGPMLLIRGEIHRAFNPNSKNYNIRNGVGIKKSSNSDTEVFFVISEDPVTFYEFTNFFKTQLDCTDALYLDGAISRMYIEWNGIAYGKLDNKVLLGPLILFYEQSK